MGNSYLGLVELRVWHCLSPVDAPISTQDSVPTFIDAAAFARGVVATEDDEAFMGCTV